MKWLFIDIYNHFEIYDVLKRGFKEHIILSPDQNMLNSKAIIQLTLVSKLIIIY